MDRQQQDLKRMLNSKRLKISLRKNEIAAKQGSDATRIELIDQIQTSAQIIQRDLHTI